MTTTKDRYINAVKLYTNDDNSPIYCLHVREATDAEILQHPAVAALAAAGHAVAAQVADADIIICGLLVEIEGGDAFDRDLVAAWIEGTRETILSLDEDAERSIARHVVETWKAPTPVVPRERLADLTLGRITEEDEEG